jgi:hypothetical protein
METFSVTYTNAVRCEPPSGGESESELADTVEEEVGPSAVLEQTADESVDDVVVDKPKLEKAELEYMRLPEDNGAPIPVHTGPVPAVVEVVDVSDLVIIPTSYCVNGAALEPVSAPPVVIGSPIVPGTQFCDTSSPMCKLAAIEHRIAKPSLRAKERSDQMPACYTGYIVDFLDIVEGLLFADTGYVPLDYNDVELTRSRPAQIAKDAVDSNLSTESGKPMVSFSKREVTAKDSVVVGRSINCAPTGCALVQTLTRFLRPFGMAMKTLHWYGPGKTPEEIIARVAQIAMEAGQLGLSIAETDHSRFESTLLIYLKWKIVGLYRRKMGPHWEEFRESYGHTADGVVKLADDLISYCCSLQSGLPDTSVIGSLMNGLQGYMYQRVEMKLDRMTAYHRLGIHSGDDGLQIGRHDVPVESPSNLGFDLKLDWKHEGQELKFLGRIYGPGVWSGDTNSMCDVPRTLSKIPLIIDPNCNEKRAKAIFYEKLYCLLFTDSQTPIIRDIIDVFASFGCLKRPDVNEFDFGKKGLPYQAAYAVVTDSTYRNVAEPWMENFLSRLDPAYADLICAFSTWKARGFATPEEAMRSYPKLDGPWLIKSGGLAVRIGDVTLNGESIQHVNPYSLRYMHCLDLLPDNYLDIEEISCVLIDRLPKGSIKTLLNFCIFMDQAISDKNDIILYTGAYGESFILQMLYARAVMYREKASKKIVCVDSDQAFNMKKMGVEEAFKQISVDMAPEGRKWAQMIIRSTRFTPELLSGKVFTRTDKEGKDVLKPFSWFDDMYNESSRKDAPDFRLLGSHKELLDEFLTQEGRQKSRLHTYSFKLVDKHREADFPGNWSSEPGAYRIFVRDHVAREVRLNNFGGTGERTLGTGICEVYLAHIAQTISQFFRQGVNYTPVTRYDINKRAKGGCEQQEMRVQTAAGAVKGDNGAKERSDSKGKASSSVKVSPARKSFLKRKPARPSGT